MSVLRIHVFQHVPFEGPGTIRQWATARGHTVQRTEFFRSPRLPSLEALDWLVIMGGPMGATDEDQNSWMTGEKAFIASAIEAGKVVLGICLGAQMIASVLGSRVYPGKQKEIGWFPVSLTREASGLPLFSGLTGDPLVFHWHGDTFDLPEGATRVAFSEVCSNQAFLYRGKVLGLQFHLEMDAGSLEQMTIHGQEELVEGDYIQSAAVIRSDPEFAYESQRRLFLLLDSLALNGSA